MTVTAPTADQTMRTYRGVVVPGYQLASGLAVGRMERPSPYPAGTLQMQASHFKARSFDLEAEVPGLFWGTVNVRLDAPLRLVRPDVTLERVDWAAGVIAPETFSFVRCTLRVEGGAHAGLIYYPHPETKPSVNDHDFAVLEILSERIAGLRYGAPAAVVCRADAFTAR